MHSSTRFGLAATLIVLSFSPRAATQDWPQWLGANRDAKSLSFQAPASWPKELTQVWRSEVGEGVATPAWVGDRIYVFSRQEGKEVTRCLEAATGKELWRDDYDSEGATGPAARFSGPRSSPVVTERRVLTLGVRGVLSCLDTATGKVLWRKQDFADAWPRFFVSSSPLIAGNLCVAQLGGSNQGGIIAYANEAKIRFVGEWRWMGDAPAYASPMLASVEGTQVVIAQTESKLVGLRLADGKLLWDVPFVVEGRGYNAATPAVHGTTVIYAGSGRGATAVRLKQQGESLVGEELWKNLDNSVQFNSPVLSGERIFGLSANNELFCLDLSSGKTLWASRLTSGSTEAEPAARPGRRGGGGSGGYGSIVDCQSVLFVLTPAAELVAVDPKADALVELARYRVADSPTYAYPVLAQDRLLVRDEQAVTLWQLP